MFKNIKSGNENKEEMEKTLKLQTKLIDAKLEEQQTKINELVDYISERFGENVTNPSIDEKLKESLQLIEKEYKNYTQKSIDSLKKDIEKQNKTFTNELDYLSSGQKDVNNKYSKFIENNEANIKEIKNTIDRRDDIISDLYKKIDEFDQTNEEFKKCVQEYFNNTNKKISKINYMGITGKFDKMLKEQNKEIDSQVKESATAINNKVASLEGNINKIVKNTSDEIIGLKNITQRITNSLNSHEDIINNLKTLLNEELENAEKQTSQISTDIQKITENNNEMSSEISKIYKAIQKNKEDINILKSETIENAANIKNDSKNKEILINELEEKLNSKIKETADGVQNSLKKIETKIQNNDSSINEVKKNHNKYAKNFDVALDRINQAISKMQEQNNEANKNLQVKIKAYIDSKNTATINELKDTINKLNLSIVEKEKLQKIEMEELLTKKLKEIQKENERILNKKIEEINNVMRNKVLGYKTSNIEVIINKDEDKPKKKIFEPIENSNILKQTASENKKLETPNTGKSQILKFFYDDEDIN